MFCTQCGTQNPEGVNTCTNCGAPLGAENNAPADKKPGFDIVALFNKFRASKYFIPGIAGCAGLILVIILLIALGGGKTKPIDNYMKAIAKTNADKYIAAFPEEYAEDWDDDDIEDELDDILDDLEDEYGKKVKISYKVLDEEKYDEDDLEDLQDSIEWYDLDDDELTAAYRIALKITYKGSKDKGSSIATFVVIKYEGKWCLHPMYS